MTEREQELQKLQQIDRNLKEAAALERQRRRRRQLINRILTRTLVVIASLSLVIVVGIGIFILAGRNRLLSRTKGAMPDLALEDVSGDGQSDMPEDSSYVWEEGWIRYGDKIYEYNDDIMTFLVMGIDKLTPVKAAEDATDGGQSDALFLVVANPDDRSVKIVAVNRDTMVDVFMYGFEQDGVTPVVKAQITVQHGFGDGLEQSCEATVDAVSGLFYGLPISGYAAVNMGAVHDLVEAVDGVDLEVLEDLTKIHSQWEKGVNVHLIGKEAYDYVHFRDTTVFESARGRLARQKQFLSVYINKMKARVKEDITLPVRLYTLLDKYMVTDITADQAAYLATRLVNYDFDKENIYTMEGTTVMGEQFEEFYPDYDALKDLMIQVFYREVNLGEAGR